MSSDEITLQEELNHFQDDPMRAFNCGPATTARPGPKPRDPTGFIDHKMFSFPPLQPSEFRSSNIYGAAATGSTHHRDSPNHHHRNWGSSPGGGSTNSGDDELDGDDVDDDEDEDDDPEDDGRDGDENNISNKNNNININNHNNKNNNSGNETVNNAGSGNPENMGNGKAKHCFGGSCTELVVKEGGSGVGQGIRESNSYQNPVTIADPDGDIYYAQYAHGGEGSASISGANGQKDIVVENGGGAGGGCGSSGRKDVSFLSEPGDPLRAILSDPVSGALMDDAMILPCGHSFGAAGIQHVLRIKVCYTCSQPVSEESVAPNLSLRAAVQAFRQEEELQFYRSPKRRRERFDQDKNSYGDSNIMDPPRSRGVQFPFAVTDRVIIKGNKRTPQRFVGREAVVTTQCLNGWYVVKTLDNAESVKLQYRSLAKVPDDASSKPMLSKMGTNWL